VAAALFGLTLRPRAKSHAVALEHAGHGH
jgi:hypothetical protein